MLANISVKELSNYYNPYTAWTNEPISIEMIQDCVNNRNYYSAYKTCKRHWKRKTHAKRIAHFVKIGIFDPIILEVISSRFHLYDGFHRFAASIFRNDKYIPAQIGGDIDKLSDFFTDFEILP